LLDLSEDSRGISLKCDPGLALELREQYPDVTPAYHFNKFIIFLLYCKGEIQIYSGKDLIFHVEVI
jgi:predicted DNA-binding protein (MmcQ/YjbR family)